MKTIHCDKEPETCQSGYAFCAMENYGRGIELGPPIWTGIEKMYHKDCRICDTKHEYKDTSKPVKELPKTPSIFGFHTGRVP